MHPIARARAAQDLSLRTLATKARISPTHLSRIEGGYNRPSEDLVRRIARVLHVDFDDLMLGLGLVPSDVVRFLVRRPEIFSKLRKQMQEEKARAS